MRRSPAAPHALAHAQTPRVRVTLDDVLKDAPLQSLFLQQLSTSDKKGFARLLFLYVCASISLCQCGCMETDAVCMYVVQCEC